MHKQQASEQRNRNRRQLAAARRRLVCQSGRTLPIHDAARASACGALSAIARNPSCGLGNRRIFERFLYSKIHCLAAALNFSRPLLASRLGIHPHHRLGPGKPVAHPRAIIENQLQPVRANNFADLASAELPRIRPQLLSELLLHLRRQAEVLALRIIGTNLVT